MAYWLKIRDKNAADPRDVVHDPDLETEVRRAVSAADTRVSQAESIRAFRILPVAFTEEQGLITPSRKLRRKVIEEVFAEEIEAIYARP